VLWCPLSGTRKDIIMKGGFVILVQNICGLNLHCGLRVSFLGGLLLARKLFHRPPELLKIQ